LTNDPSPPSDDRRGSRRQWSPAEPTSRDIFSKIGIDIDDVDEMREVAADLYWIRRQRRGHQDRVKMTWTSVISSIIAAMVAAAGVVFSNLWNKGSIH
jgi:hypothetical protein